MGWVASVVIVSCNTSKAPAQLQAILDSLDLSSTQDVYSLGMLANAPDQVWGVSICTLLSPTATVQSLLFRSLLHLMAARTFPPCSVPECCSRAEAGNRDLCSQAGA